MTKRIALVALLLSAVVVGFAMLRLTTVWNQPLSLPAEGVLITVAKGESLGQVLARAEDNQWLSRSPWVGLSPNGKVWMSKFRRVSLR